MSYFRFKKSAPTDTLVMGGTAAGNTFDISDVSYSSLESKFNELMALMHAPPTGISTPQARTEQQQNFAITIVSLLEYAQEQCGALLQQGNAEAAEKMGIQMLRLRERFYGANHLELVPAYFHLARVKQFLEQFGDAEDMLSHANYIVLRNQERVSFPTKAELHQTYGLLYAADDKLDAAVKHLTCASYYMSCLHGPEHVLTTFSYFDLGNVFAAKACVENAMAIYDAIKEIWYAHLATVLDEVLCRKVEAENIKKYDDEEFMNFVHASSRSFGAENLADTSKMLHGIYSIQKERFRVAHPSPTRAAFVLGLFLLWVEEYEDAEQYLQDAHKFSQLFYGLRHPVVTEIEDWCTKFDVQWSSKNEILEQSTSVADAIVEE